MRSLMMSIGNTTQIQKATKMNKLTITTLIALSSLASAAFANLGDTYKQSVARYGKPQKNLGNGWVWWVTDQDNTVTENFGENGRCRVIEYRRFTGVSYSPTELLTRISQNFPASHGNFSEYPVDLGRFWGANDGSGYTALLTVEDNPEGRNPMKLSVWAPEMHQAVEAADKAAAEKTNVTYN